MKIQIQFSIVVLCLISSAVGAQKSVFNMKLEKPDKIPSLSLEIDQESIARAYNSSFIQSNTSYYNNEISEEYISSTTFGDQKLSDVYNLLDAYLKTYEINDDSMKGTLVLDFKFYNYEYNISAGFFFNVFTLGIGYLLGIPVDKATTVVEISASIYDVNQSLISNYAGFGKEVKRNGLYYRRKNQRFQNIDALKKAIYALNDQILADQEIIKLNLMSSSE